MIDLSIVIPAYNESQRITPFLRDLTAHCKRSSKKYEILIVDDGSTDGTADVVAPFLSQYPFLRLVRCPVNRGKGAAVRVGMLQAVGRHRLFMDADGSFSPDEIESAAAWLDTGYDVVIGSRFVEDDTRPIEETWHHRILRTVLNAMVAAVLDFKVRDSQCGFKLFGANAAQTLFSKNRIDDFAFDLELLHMAAKAGFRIKETRVACIPKKGSKVRMVRDTFRLFVSIFKIRSASGSRHSVKHPLDVPVA